MALVKEEKNPKMETVTVLVRSIKLKFKPKGQTNTAYSPYKCLSINKKSKTPTLLI